MRTATAITAFFIMMVELKASVVNNWGMFFMVLLVVPDVTEINQGKCLAVHEKCYGAWSTHRSLILMRLSDGPAVRQHSIFLLPNPTWLTGGISKATLWARMAIVVLKFYIPQSTQPKQRIEAALWASVIYSLVSTISIGVNFCGSGRHVQQDIIIIGGVSNVLIYGQDEQKWWFLGLIRHQTYLAAGTPRKCTTMYRQYALNVIDVLTLLMSIASITSKTNKNVVLNSTAVCIELF